MVCLIVAYNQVPTQLDGGVLRGYALVVHDNVVWVSNTHTHTHTHMCVCVCVCVCVFVWVYMYGYICK